MAVNNILGSNTAQIVNIDAQKQVNNTAKLSTGFKVNRNSDDAASLSIKTKNTDATVAENKASSMSNINDIDKADAMVEQAKANILANADDALKAQANSAAIGVASLVQ